MSWSDNKELSLKVDVIGWNSLQKKKKILVDKTIHFYILRCLERNMHKMLRLFEIANANTSKWIRLNFPCDTMREEDNKNYIKKKELKYSYNCVST